MSVFEDACSQSRNLSALSQKDQSRTEACIDWPPLSHAGCAPHLGGEIVEDLRAEHPLKYSAKKHAREQAYEKAATPICSVFSVLLYRMNFTKFHFEK